MIYNKYCNIQQQNKKKNKKNKSSQFWSHGDYNLYLHLDQSKNLQRQVKSSSFI